MEKRSLVVRNLGVIGARFPGYRAECADRCGQQAKQQYPPVGAKIAELFMGAAGSSRVLAFCLVELGDVAELIISCYE